MSQICSDLREFRRIKPRTYWSVCLCLTITVLIVAIVLLAGSFHTIDSTEVGVEYDTQERKLGGVKGEGLHAGPPFFEFKEFSSVFVTREITTVCVSKDGLEVEATASFQYLPDRKHVDDITQSYTDASKFDEVIIIAATSAIHHSCGDFEVAEFQSRRADLQERQKFYMQELFAPLNATVEGVQLQNVRAPYEWEQAVERKEDAREDITLARNERIQEITRAETNLKRAEEEAKVILANARNTAKIILKKAEAEAEKLKVEIQTDVNKTRDAMDKLNLTTDAMLRYVLNRQIETRPRLLTALKPPATTPRDEL